MRYFFINQRFDNRSDCFDTSALRRCLIYITFFSIIIIFKLNIKIVFLIDLVKFVEKTSWKIDRKSINIYII